MKINLAGIDIVLDGRSIFIGFKQVGIISLEP